MTPATLHELAASPEQTKYDYREQWMVFTRRLSRRVGADEIAREVAEFVVDATGAASAAVYLVEAGGTACRLQASVGGVRFASTVQPTAAVPSWRPMAASPVALPHELLSSIATPALPGGLAVPIPWRATLLGLIVLGPQRSGTEYSVEDFAFLATVAEQTAAPIMAIRLADAGATPRQPEPSHRLAASAIHDIKNSVSALSLLARNAAGNFSDPEFQRDTVATLTRTVDRMRRLLVKLSSPDLPTPLSRGERIDLQALIIEATTPLAADRKIRLVRQLRPVKPVYGDRDALLRVVENLTTNAAEAIEHEGTVTVTLAQDRDHAIISVADTGCGIPEEYQARHLFFPFRSTKKDGWGVGLYQSKQAVESQDGEIYVKSVVGGGTTFTVKLPLRADVENSSLESVR
jgi:putative PEP-CTERM system histidine kinase